MKRIALLFLVIYVSLGCGPSREYQPQNGDIIFHTSRSSQSLAIQKATKSKYSHMGIVYLKDGKPFVFEAVEPVKFTPLRDWIVRGEGGHYVVKRLSNSEKVLTPDAIKHMLEVRKTFEGRHYDLYFEWSDDRIYCSELVWKIYKRSLGIELGKLQTLGEFDLSDSVVHAKVHERFGDSLPQNEPVISPVAIFASNQLIKIYEN